LSVKGSGWTSPRSAFKRSITTSISSSLRNLNEGLVFSWSGNLILQDAESEESDSEQMVETYMNANANIAIPIVMTPSIMKILEMS
jgi:hypothetical protein